MSTSRTTTEAPGGRAAQDNISWPGRVLKNEFLDPLNISEGELSSRTGISVEKVGKIIRNELPIDTATAARLGLYFGTSREFWTNMQISYDLRILNLNEDLSWIRSYDSPDA